MEKGLKSQLLTDWNLNSVCTKNCAKRLAERSSWHVYIDRCRPVSNNGDKKRHWKITKRVFSVDLRFPSTISSMLSVSKNKLYHADLLFTPNYAKPSCHLPILKFTLTYEFRPKPKHIKAHTYKHHKKTTPLQVHTLQHAQTNERYSYCFPSWLETTLSFIGYNFHKTKNLTFLNFRFITNFKK